MLGPLTKEPDEIFPVDFDFTQDLGAGETIQTAQVTSRNRETDADTTGTFVSGPAGISSPHVSQRVTGGASGENHVLKCVVTTSVPNTFVARALVRVEAE